MHQTMLFFFYNDKQTTKFPRLYKLNYVLDVRSNLFLCDVLCTHYNKIKPIEINSTGIQIINEIVVKYLIHFNIVNIEKFNFFFFFLTFMIDLFSYFIVTE